MKSSHLIRKILDQTIPDPQIPLHHKDPYTLLIAVLLSAQCTDERVNRITPSLFALADTPETMISLTIEQIASLIRPCGLASRKAKAIWELSKILVDKRQGQVPKTMQGLLALPGVGRKTASVVLSQAFNKPAFPVDTHIFRCAKRWGLSHGKNVEQTEIDLKKAFPRSQWNRLHLQIILYARKYCPAKGHRIEPCPICNALK